MPAAAQQRPTTTATHPSSLWTHRMSPQAQAPRNALWTALVLASGSLAFVPATPVLTSAPLALVSNPSPCRVLLASNNNVPQDSSLCIQPGRKLRQLLRLAGRQPALGSSLCWCECWATRVANYGLPRRTERRMCHKAVLGSQLVGR